jgi:hypothetical protein
VSIRLRLTIFICVEYVIAKKIFLLSRSVRFFNSSAFHAARIDGNHDQFSALYRVIWPHPVRSSEHSSLAIISYGQARKSVPDLDAVNVDQSIFVGFSLQGFGSRLNFIRVPSFEPSTRVRHAVPIGI